MNSLIIEHLPVEQLPDAWRGLIGEVPKGRVTVRIEPEHERACVPAIANEPPPEFADDPSFGMWRDREDMADVQSYLRRVRTPRYLRNVSADES